jgi:outer membrane protein assembly factor BamD (BamD/ComL family)
MKPTNSSLSIDPVLGRRRKSALDAQTGRRIVFRHAEFFVSNIERRISGCLAFQSFLRREAMSFLDNAIRMNLSSNHSKTLVLRMNESRKWAVCLCAVLSITTTSGCSTFGGRDAAMASYEQTRQQMMGDANGSYSPDSYDSEPDSQAPLSLASFAPEHVSDTVRDLAGLGPDANRARQAMQEAEAIYKNAVAFKQQNRMQESNEQFALAAEKYGQSASYWPDSTLGQDALFMKGECNFFADRYWDAEQAYEALLDEYPNSRHLDRVQPRRFAIADYWLDLHREDPQAFYEWNFLDPERPSRDAFGHAMRIFDRIRLDDPTGKLADDATIALANAHFAEGDFLKADDYYTDLRMTFPSSDLQFSAHLLGLKSKLMNYQGSDYSANALNEAEILLKQLYKQFPTQVAKEAEYLRKAGAEIRYRLAERMWDRAKRRDRRSEYGAARLYYELLLADFGDTPFAGKARQRLQQIGLEPDIPKQPLSWFVNLFPETDTVKPLIESN